MKTAKITVIFSLFSFLFMEFLGVHIANIFVSGESEIIKLTNNAITLFSVVYLINGINIMASAFFTSVNNGKISAIISTSRSLVFVVAGLLLLPQFLKLNGVWLSVPFAELVTLTLTIFFIKNNKRRYLAA